MATPPVNDDQALGFDPGLAVEHLRAADPVLARIIDEIGPFRMRLRPAQSVFAALAEAIVYQQLNGKAAAAIFARVCALFPEGAPTPERMPPSSWRTPSTDCPRRLRCPTPCPTRPPCRSRTCRAWVSRSTRRR